jgi:hypothetical protein
MVSKRIEYISQQLAKCTRALGEIDASVDNGTYREARELIEGYNSLLDHLHFVYDNLVERIESADDFILVQQHAIPLPACHHDERYWSRYMDKHNRLDE